MKCIGGAFFVFMLLMVIGLALGEGHYPNSNTEEEQTP